MELATTAEQVSLGVGALQLSRRWYFVIYRVAFAIAAISLFAPVRVSCEFGGGTLEAQRVPIYSSDTLLGPVALRRPTIVLFHYGEVAAVKAEARRQVERLRPALDSIGVTIVERNAALVDYVAAGSMVRWVAARDSLPHGYLFLHRSGLTFIRYGMVPDSTLAAAVQLWSPPHARLVVP